MKCVAWRRGTQPCRNRAVFEGHVTEGTWAPVCRRHTAGYSYLVELPKTPEAATMVANDSEPRTG